MSARRIFEVLVLGIALSTVACTQRTIIEEQTDDGSPTPAATAAEDEETAIVQHPLYVRSGNSDPGEQQGGPHPEPWQEYTGPHPEPWNEHVETKGASGGSNPKN